MKKYRRLISAILMIISISIPFTLAARTYIYGESTQDTVRVAYFDYGDFMSCNDTGNYVGFSIELLEELSKYSNWNYEFVDCGNWKTAMDLMNSGQIDLLPAVHYTPQRAESMYFPKLPSCHTYSVLYVRSDETRYDFEDFESFDGMKVGLVSGSHDSDEFNKYGELHNFQADTIIFDETAQAIDALKQGQLDGIAVTYLGRSSTLKSVAQFSPEPMYVAVSKSRPDLLTEMNDAQSSLQLRNPSFTSDLYAKYFSVTAHQVPVFTKEEQAYLEQAGEITAVYDASWAPVAYQDPLTGEFSGITADVFAQITAYTGLKFRFIPAENYASALEKAISPSVELVCAITRDYLSDQKNKMSTTQHYLRASMVLLSADSKKETHNIAMVRGYLSGQALTENNPGKNIQYYDTPEACLAAVQSGSADAAYVNTYIADYLMTTDQYKDWSISFLTNYAEDISIGVSASADPQLFAILDKCIGYIASEQIDGIILNNSAKSQTITWNDIVQEYPLGVIGGMILTFVVILLLVLVLFIQKIRNQERIGGLLYQDSLTGLSNLNKFRIDAARMLKNNQNNGYAVLYADIKEFRIINDTMGFTEGDAILRILADILRSTVSDNETCARVSADHFVLLLRYDGLNGLLKRTASIDRQLNQWISDNGKSYRIILGFGVYVVDSSSSADVSLMLDFANYARRSITSLHKNRVVLYDSAVREADLLQRGLSDRVTNALENREFIVYYQPKVDMKTRSLVGSEALIRWNTPDKGILNPGQFIPYFEKSGFVIELDFYVYEEVCRSLRRWMNEGLPISPVSCNFSRLHFSDATFAVRLVGIADRYEIPYQYLELEVTESVFSDDLDQILPHFMVLQKLGFPISIDDFGSGYSSLGLLQQFSADIIKLDRTFIDINSGMNGPRKQAVINGIVNIAAKLNMSIICEGVETPEQVETLLAAGCHTAQGFYYAKPMPCSDFEQLLHNPVL